MFWNVNIKRKVASTKNQQLAIILKAILFKHLMFYCTYTKKYEDKLKIPEKTGSIGKMYI